MPTSTTIQDIERIIGSLYLELRITQEQYQEQAIQLADARQKLEVLKAEKEEADDQGDPTEERG